MRLLRVCQYIVIKFPLDNTPFPCPRWGSRYPRERMETFLHGYCRKIAPPRTTEGAETTIPRRSFKAWRCNPCRYSHY